MVAVSPTAQRAATNPGVERLAGQWTQAAAVVVIVLTVAVAVVEVGDASRIASPPRSSLRFHDGAVQVFAVANGDVPDAAEVRTGDRIVAAAGHPLT